MIQAKVCKKMVNAFLSNVDVNIALRILKDIDNISGLNGQYRHVNQDVIDALEREKDKHEQ